MYFILKSHSAESLFILFSRSKNGLPEEGGQPSGRVGTSEGVCGVNVTGSHYICIVCMSIYMKML
jgi:hypothetical protein